MNLGFPGGVGKTHELASLCKAKDWVFVVGSLFEKDRIEREYGCRCMVMGNLRDATLFSGEGPLIYDTASVEAIARSARNEIYELNNEISEIRPHVDDMYWDEKNERLAKEATK